MGIVIGNARKSPLKFADNRVPDGCAFVKKLTGRNTSYNQLVAARSALAFQLALLARERIKDPAPPRPQQNRAS
jgi:hypothetical protein